VTLAGLATVLALLGFDVDCVCYSTYLSERDHNDFANLFVAFGVDKRVHYGNFNKLAENMLNGKGNIRDLTCNFLTTGAGSAATSVKEGSDERVLLIDEVDVFFKSDFYGNMYAPLATLKSKAFEALATHAWSLYTAGRCTFGQLQSTPAYNELLDLFHSDHTDIIVECIKQMTVDLRGVVEHEQQYLVKDGRIVCVFRFFACWRCSSVPLFRCLPSPPCVCLFLFSPRVTIGLFQGRALALCLIVIVVMVLTLVVVVVMTIMIIIVVMDDDDSDDSDYDNADDDDEAETTTTPRRR
jgi:hypothetical protein